MKNPWYIVLGALVVALLLGLWWWQGGDAVVPPPTTPRESAPPEAEASTPAAAATATPEPTRSAAVEAAGNPSEAPAELHRFDILVVDAATQQPVADAEVVYSDATSRASMRALPIAEARLLLDDGELLARRFGRTARSDSSGRLQLWMERHGGLVCARVGSRYGEVRVRDGEPPALGYRLLLELEERLLARVVDTAGNPVAGVPVGLRARSGEPMPSAVSGQHDYLHRSVTSDANGLASFPHLQELRSIPLGPQEGKPAAGFELGIAIPGFDLAPIEVDATVPLPPDPVELRLPATGALRIRYRLAGAALSAVELVILRATAGEDRRSGDLEVDAQVDADGWAVFPVLPAGKRMFVEPHGFGVFSLPSAELPPLVAGATLQHEIDLVGLGFVLRGRLLDRDGQPLAGASVHVAYRVSRSSGFATVKVDENGQFLHALPRVGDATTVRIERYDLTPEGHGGLRASLEPRELQLGVHDFGDLRIGGEPLVCSGRFAPEVDPQSQVQLVVERLAPARRTGEPTWTEVRGLAAGHKAGRTFEVRGNVEVGPLRLRVVAREFLPVAPIEFRLGQGDVVVPLVSGARLVATCVMPEQAPEGEPLRLELVGGPALPTVPGVGRVRPGEPKTHRQARLSRWEAGRARYEWSAVEPGKYALQICVPGCAEPLLSIDDVVLPLPDSGDPRLASIDLRQVLRVVTLRLEALEDGGERRLAMDRDLHAFLQPQEDPAAWEGFLLRPPAAALLLPSRPVSMLVASRSGPPATVSIPPSVEVVDIERTKWPELELRLAPGTVVPDGCELYARLLPKGGPGAGRFLAQYRGSSSSGVLADLLRPAEAMGLLTLDRSTRSAIGDGVAELRIAMRCGTRHRDLQRFTPNEVVAGAPVTITLDAAELAAAAKALAPKDAPK
ncbi:MAG: hypothetical protein JNL12_18225 [Planctomycetes bacterium]|nr:hypothetical protein [Planctomycetota bacterium]